MIFRTRFAPSPTGPLHLGHAYSAWIGAERARAQNGAFLLRIEDIDQSRARGAWERQIYDDLGWLGLTWPEPVMRQSDRMFAYEAALDRLWQRGLLYMCTCNRRDIREAATAPQDNAPLLGADGIIYPGTCRPQTPPTGVRPSDANLRLNLREVAKDVEHITFHETGAGPRGESGKVTTSIHDMISCVGDVLLARKDMATSYHLSVVVDDAEQGISEVVRGQDLFDATQIHVLLQNLLDLPTPNFHHHKLIRDSAGKRLAKRDDARALASYRADGEGPEDVLRRLDLKT